MPSIINATTTTGLVSSADNSGSLQLATNNGTTAVTINTSQQVGIGSGTPSGILHTFKANTDSTVNFEATTAGYASNLQLIANNSAGGSYNNLTSFAGTTALWRIGGGGVADTITFSTGSSYTERMRITSAGVLQVGNNNGTGEVFAQNTVKVWGSVNSGPGTLYTSFGVSSISKNSTGYFTINFTRTFSSERFGMGGAGYGGAIIISGGNESTTSTGLRSYNDAGSLTDTDFQFLIAAGSS
jgi:hypothetical protein